jgi:hypothetical protein
MMAKLGCFVLIVAVNLTVGSWAARYVIEFWLHKDPGFWLGALIGLFGGQVTIPAALLTWLLHAGGIV